MKSILSFLDDDIASYFSEYVNVDTKDITEAVAVKAPLQMQLIKNIRDLTIAVELLAFRLKEKK